MKNLRTVMRIARHIRRHAVNYHENVYGYSPKFIDLGGWCALTSNVLFEELHRRGIKSTLRWNGDHCFLTYGKWIIDITATQFDANFPKVVKQLRKSNDSQKFWWKEKEKVSTLREREMNDDWAAGAVGDHQKWQDEMRKSFKKMR